MMFLLRAILLFCLGQDITGSFTFKRSVFSAML